MFDWKILELESQDGTILKAKYLLSATDGKNTVTTEGFWTFSDKIVKKPFSEVTEQDVASWIELETTTNGVCHIKSNLEKQLEYLAQESNKQLPWKPFTINIKDLA